MKQRLTKKSTEYVYLGAVIVTGIFVVGTATQIKKTGDIFVPIILAAVLSLALYRFRQLVSLSFDDECIYLSKFGREIVISYEKIISVKQENAVLSGSVGLQFSYTIRFENDNRMESKIFFVPVLKDKALLDLKAHINQINPYAWPD
jgi:hypothetical protein